MAKKPVKKEEQTPTPAEALDALQNIATQLNSIVPPPKQEQTTMTNPEAATSAPEQQANAPTPTVVPAQSVTPPPAPEQQANTPAAAPAPTPAPLTLESVNARVDNLEQRVKNVEDATSNILNILAAKECLEEITPTPVVISGDSSSSSVPGWVYPTAAVCGVAAVGIAAYHVFKD